MLGFKQYAILTFHVSLTERIRNHFLKYIGPDIFLYLQDKNFLEALTDQSGKKDKGIKFFIGQVDEAGSIYNKLYNKFIGSEGLGDKIKYYRIAGYYLKLNNLTLNPLKKKGVLAESNEAIKEIFAEQLYDYMVRINDAREADIKKIDIIGSIKSSIKKTFVPEFKRFRFNKGQRMITATEGPFKGKTFWQDWAGETKPDSLLYDNDAITFEGKVFTVKWHPCSSKDVHGDKGATLAYLCKGHTTDGVAKHDRLKMLEALYKSNDNIEKVDFGPDAGGFPWTLASFNTTTPVKVTGTKCGGYDIVGDCTHWLDIKTALKDPKLENQFQIIKHSWFSQEAGKHLFWKRFGPETTKLTTYTKLLSEGAYVEYFFRFDLQELVDNLAQIIGDGKDLQDSLMGKGWASTTLYNEVASIAKTSPGGVAGKYDATSYYSLVKFANFIGEFYGMADPKKETDNYGNLRIIPSEAHIDEAFEQTKIEFGARLVVSTPNLPYETNSSKINFPPYDKVYPTDLHPGQKTLDPAYVPLTFAAMKYAGSEDSAPRSAWKNKTYIYTLLDKTPHPDSPAPPQYWHRDWTTLDKTKSAWYYYPTSVFSFPIGEEAVELTNVDKIRFLKDFYSGSTALRHISMIAHQHTIRFPIDQFVIGKYSQTILDGLFEKGLVKQYFESEVVGKKYVQLTQDVYKKVVDTTPVADLPLFIEGTSERKTFVEECDKTDDKTDQNLITLVNSIEGV